MKSHSDINKVAFLGNYLPRLCGIATFTTDLSTSVAAQYPDTKCFTVSVNDIPAGYDYPKEVGFEIEEQNVASYQRAADFLSISDVDVLCVQHEFGIYGGPAGSYLLALLRDLNLPIVTTLHTVLKDPNPDQKRVMQELIQLSTRMVVMAQKGKEFLRDIYKAPESKIDLIPHGIHETSFVDPNFYKDLFGVEGRPVLLTFGLLSPNKGIENVINALPKIVSEFPNVVYIIMGATHPNVLREHGESYRLSLELLAKKIGVQKNVIFYNRFVGIDELKEFIGAADIYITPYLNENQIVSGSLAYCFGAGKAVVSTPYWYAQELLADNRGALVPFADPGAIAREVSGLLRDETRRTTMRKAAYKMGLEMGWGNVARSYMNSFERARGERAGVTRKLFAVKTLDKQMTELPAIKLDHLFRMTDSTGVFQHAIMAVPNFSHGYCTDDNARALILTVLLDEMGDDSPLLRNAATTYAAFLHHAFDPMTKRFRNFMGFNRDWMEEGFSEDSHGRALWALGVCVGRSNFSGFQTMAGQIFVQALPGVLEFSSPRAWAMALIGAHEYLRRFGGDRTVNHIRESLANRLMELYGRIATPDWPWFEDSLTYMNAKLSHALILSGQSSGRADMVEVGLKSLKWLSKIQSAESGLFRPVGSNGFYKSGGPRALFDQQPIEAQVTMSACLEAYRVTGDNAWFDEARRTFDWFLGWNDLGTLLYDPNSGGCQDGLHVDRVNQNQGAESTLAFLLALAELQKAQNDLTSFKNIGLTVYA